VLKYIGIFSGWMPENQLGKCMKAGTFYQGLLQQEVLLFPECGKLHLEINRRVGISQIHFFCHNLLWFSSSTAKIVNFISVTKT